MVSGWCLEVLTHNVVLQLYIHLDVLHIAQDFLLFDDLVGFISVWFLLLNVLAH